MSKTPAITVCLALISVLAGCGPSAQETSPDGSAADRPLRIVATTGMIGDLAARVAGERATVETLMGPGIDPHLFKASESDVRRLAEADLILYNGLHLEGKMGDVLVKMARTRPVIPVSETIPESELREPPEFQGMYDPHVWFDVSLWARTVAPVVRELASLRPAHAAEFEERGAALVRELEELDVWVGQRIAEIPDGQRVLVTAHDAFGYFGRRYGLEVVGLQGISTLAEAGLNDVDRVVDLVVGQRIKAIFVEASVSPRAIEAVQAACRHRGWEVVIGGQLYSDSLGPAGSPAGTYVGTVRANVETVVKALS